MSETNRPLPPIPPELLSDNCSPGGPDWLRSRLDEELNWSAWAEWLDRQMGVREENGKTR